MDETGIMMRDYLVYRKRALGMELAQIDRMLAQLDGTASEPNSARDPRPSRALRKAQANGNSRVLTR